MMSRLQIFCRDITLLLSTPSSAAYAAIPCRDLHQIPFNLPDVATSELDCVDLQAASITQPVAFISVLLLTAFLSTYCCIFLLSFSLPVNDKLVSFFIIMHINYSILDENQTEKWTKNR